MSLKEFTLYYGAMKVCCQEKYLVTSMFQEINWASLERQRGLFLESDKQRANAKELPWGSFQDTYYLNTVISRLKAFEDLTVRRQFLLNFHAPSTSVSSC